MSNWKPRNNIWDVQVKPKKTKIQHYSIYHEPLSQEWISERY